VVVVVAAAAEVLGDEVDLVQVSDSIWNLDSKDSNKFTFELSVNWIQMLL
jgi:hypothetical protein